MSSMFGITLIVVMSYCNVDNYVTFGGLQVLTSLGASFLYESNISPIIPLLSLPFSPKYPHETLK